MGLFSGCMLACDIDETLMIDGKIHKRNIEKIEYFMEEGGCFSLATGRTVGAVSPVLGQLKRVSPSVVANGGMLYDYEAQTVLYEAHIPESDYRIVREVLGMEQGIGIEVHAGQQVLTVFETDETRDHQRYELLESRAVSFEEACRFRWNKVVYMLNGPKEPEQLKKILSALSCTSVFMETSANFGGRKRWYLEQIPLGTSKADGLDRLCKLLNIRQGRKFAMGDYYNDLEMLKNADIGAAPAGAPDEIKANADFIAGPCEDGAVADFIDYLGAFLQSELRKRPFERKDKMEAAEKRMLETKACKVRLGIIEGVHSAKSGHPGGSLSCADILTYLYFKKMHIDPANPKAEERDRFVLSKGHAAPALYAVLAERGFFGSELLGSLRQIGCILQGHPDMKHIPGVDMSTGSLGQGVSAAVGMALSAKHFGDSYRVYSILGDGEIEEGQVWEAAMFAANKGLSNLTVFVDYNNLQIDGTIEEVNSAAPIDRKFEAFNWHTITIDGHDFDSIEAALAEAETVDKPVAIIAKTVKGKGVSFMENAVGWHGSAPNDEQYEQAVTELRETLAALEQG